MNKQLDNLAFLFFKLFAQYESYLKDHGYFSTTKSGNIIVDWDRFVNENIGSDFIKQLGDNVDSADYILSNPPMRQVPDTNNRIIWKEVPNNDKSVQMLFSHISRIRNNLFHGAKLHGTWFDPNRSKKLLSNGLTVLNNFKGLVDIQ
ncbi:MAG: hypothetical protein COB26_10205 [Piscirickettsiaceae bacterium]|nr:MAG: hypothetical protein COB26_10205 [Piscirickettsiaceae bacterium]